MSAIHQMPLTTRIVVIHGEPPLPISLRLLGQAQNCCLSEMCLNRREPGSCFAGFRAFPCPIAEVLESPWMNIETTRLILRPPVLADVPLLFQFLGDAEAMRYTHCDVSLRQCRRRIAVHEWRRRRDGYALGPS